MGRTANVITGYFVIDVHDLTFTLLIVLMIMMKIFNIDIIGWWPSSLHVTVVVVIVSVSSSLL